MVADPLFENGEYVLSGRRLIGVPFRNTVKSTSNWQPYSTISILPRKYRFTDKKSCALDAFNGAVGLNVLTRQKFEAEGVGPGLAIDLSSKVAQRIIQKETFQLVRVGTRQNVPSLLNVMEQPEGEFIFEFYWRIDNENKSYHSIAVKCTSRKILCNTAGEIGVNSGK